MQKEKKIENMWTNLTKKDDILRSACISSSLFRKKVKNESDWFFLEKHFPNYEYDTYTLLNWSNIFDDKI